MTTKQAIQMLRKRGQAVTEYHIETAKTFGFLPMSFEQKDIIEWAKRGCPSGVRSLVWPDGTDEEFEAYVQQQEARLPLDRLELARFCAQTLSIARLARQECDRLSRENAKLRLALAHARAE